MLTRRASLLAAVLLLLAVPDAPAKKLSFFAGGGGGTPITTAAYYVATTGNDGNAGTLTAPFLTLGKCQSAMQGGSTKTCYIRGGSYTPTASGTDCQGYSTVLELTSSDNNEVWSYYPPDGYGSAAISGNGTAGCGFYGNGATGVTINGLTLTAFTDIAIYMHNGSSHWIVENNTLHDMTALPVTWDDGGASVEYSLVTQNYIYNITGWPGIAFYGVNGNDVNNSTITANLIINVCIGRPDCGSVYFFDTNATASTGCVIGNNYLSLSDGVSVYLDDGASNCAVSGTMMLPGAASGFPACVIIHGGINDVFTGNICDESTGLADGFVWYQTSTARDRGMTGNVWQNNILVGAIASGGGNGYTGSLSPANPMTIADNAYWNYGAGGNLTHTGTGGAGSDSAATNENPSFTCGWPYTLPSSSAVYASPVSFPAQPGAWGTAGFWGPPGLSLPHTGTTPSPPHTC
jgi:hypothetical protein